MYTPNPVARGVQLVRISLADGDRSLVRQGDTGSHQAEISSWFPAGPLIDTTQILRKN